MFITATAITNAIIFRLRQANRRLLLLQKHSLLLHWRRLRRDAYTSRGQEQVILSGKDISFQRVRSLAQTP